MAAAATADDPCAAAGLETRRRICFDGAVCAWVGVQIRVYVPQFWRMPPRSLHPRALPVRTAKSAAKGSVRRQGCPRSWRQALRRTAASILFVSSSAAVLCPNWILQGIITLLETVWMREASPCASKRAVTLSAMLTNVFAAEREAEAQRLNERASALKGSRLRAGALRLEAEAGALGNAERSEIHWQGGRRRDLQTVCTEVLWRKIHAVGA
jgi:hypothetical protein